MKNMMKNRSKKITILFIPVLFVFLLSNSFAAVVSDNDGSAFISKAEFDSLKNNFQSQLDQYNTSIDNKIDSAISTYLAGVKVDKEVQVRTLVDYAVNNYIYCYDATDPLAYKYGWPIIYGDFVASGFTQWGSANREIGIRVIIEKGTPTSSNYQDKTVIQKIKNVQGATDSWFAQWYGLCNNAVDALYFNVTSMGISDGANQPANQYKYIIATGQGGSYSSGILKITNNELIGSTLWYLRTCTSAIETQPNGYGMYGGSNGTHIISPFYSGAICRGIENDWGNLKNEEIVINKSYNYDMFSNYDRNKNWGYYGNYKTSFITGFPKTNGQQWVVVSDGGGQFNKTDNPNILKYCCTGTMSSNMYSTYWSNTTTRPSTGATLEASNTIGIATYTNRSGAATDVRFYFPLIGFEDTYLKRWNQIVSKNTSSIAAKEVALNNTSTGIIKDPDGNPFLNVCAGLPVATLEKKQYLKQLKVSFDSSDTHIVWFSNRPFNPDLNPQDNTTLINNMTGGTYNSTYKGYVVTNQEVNFAYKRDDMDKEEILYMKWAKFTAPSTIKANVGVKLSDTFIVANTD